MTFEEITQEITTIQHLAETDPDTAIQRNTQLFVELNRQDEVYWILDKNGTAYTAPAQDNDPRVFLRIFSCLDAATAFAKQTQLETIEVIDGVEMLQAAKSFFLRGVYGFLLNDGFAWAAISFPDFLKKCFEHILGDPSLARKEYVELVEFINMVRHNDFYHLAIVHQTLTPADKPEQLTVVSPSKSVHCEEYTYEELTVLKLVKISTMENDCPIHIQTDKLSFSTSLDLLRAALTETGILGEDQNTEDYHIETIALDFLLTDFREQDQQMAPQSSFVELPPCEEEEPKNTDESGLSASLNDRTSLNEFLLKEINQRASKKEIPSESRQDSGHIFLKLISIRRVLLVVTVGLVLALGLVIGTLLVKPSAEEQFAKALEAGEYASIPASYESAVAKSPNLDASFQSQMADDLSDKLEQYAADTYSKDELLAVLSAYKKIPVMQEPAERAKVTAAELERSKAAYEQGRTETSVLAKLAAWQNVIKKDTGSMQKMSEDLSQHQSEYKYTVFLSVQDKKVDMAVAQLMLLQNYYPDDPEIPDKIKTLLANAGQGANGTDNSLLAPHEKTNAPAIAISKIDVKENIGKWNGQMDLYIDWTNQSGKEISRVLFTVIPYDRSGKQAATQIADEDGDYYSMFLATDEGPFAPGHKTPSGHYWEAAWYNNAIVRAELQAVTITFSDGSGSITYDSTEIPQLLS